MSRSLKAETSKQSASEKVAQQIAVGIFFLGGVFVLFAWFVVEEFQDRVLVAGGGAIFLLIILGLQRLAVNAIRDSLLRAQVSEARYRSFLENIPTITYINDISPEALTLYVSPQIENVLGYTQNEFVSDPLLWMKIIVPEDQERVLKENAQTFESLDMFSIEYRIFAKDGRIVWVKDEAILVYGEDKTPQYWLGVWTDITSNKEAEKSQSAALEVLTKRTVQLQTASEVSRAAASILELDELLPEVVELIRSHFDYYYVGIFLVDEKFETLMLRAATGDVGKQMLLFQHALPVGESSMVGWSVTHNKARIALDVGKDAVRFKNSLLPLTRSELSLPLRARGRVIGAMTIQSRWEAAFSDSDILALQTMTDQVANAIETARLFDDRSTLIKELEAKNAELEQFAYTVSHDLKSPLVTMRGFLGYLHEDAKRGDLVHFEKDLARVVNATKTMQSLLNDLLMLSKVGRTTDVLEDVPFGDIVQEAINLILDSSNINAPKVVIEKNLPMVRCVRVRISEIIQNLVVNSMKFMGDQQNPSIWIGSKGLDTATGFPVFYVRDNGIGIEPKYHDRIFGLFNRLHPEMDGTGIGLTLVKRIVEVHGGRIWVESAGKNTGSTFYFTLPPAVNNRDVIEPK
ncbi:MAG: ATP-binding protein [Anaerolineales bacterium]